ncbi:MAG TPA: Vms1/Ankzf1 family peptidyl-tRNA hydrolase, partial [Pyrinomonadaceae bacterium]
MSLSDLMERLSAFEPAPFPFISLYLNAQADQHGRNTYGGFVRRELAQRARTFAPHSAERESFDRDVERVTTYLDNEVRPSANGIAVFACAGADDFFEAAQLDAPVERNRLFVFNQPHLYPLARLMDQYPRYAVLLADTNVARIFVFGRGRKIDEQEIQNVKTQRGQMGGWSQMRYQRHVENYHEQHAKECVEMLGRVVEAENIERVILAGTEETIIPLLKSEMPQQLADKVVDAVTLEVNAPEHEVLEETTKALRVHDAVTDADKV